MQRKCHVPGPAAEVEHLRTWTLQHLAEDAGSAVPPDPVDVHREHMVQQIVARRDRREHIAHRFGGGCFVSRSGWGGAHDALSRGAIRRFNRQFVMLGQRYASDNFLISSTAWITAPAGTVLTTSTFPMLVGKMKCGTPPTVFLSERSRFAMPSLLTSTLGKGAYARTSPMMRCAVSGSVICIPAPIMVAAIMPLSLIHISQPTRR